MDTKKLDFSQGKALVIGDVMLDQYWFGNTERISPEAPVPVVKIQRSDERLGGAANTAANIRALGMPCILLGALGQDEAGQTIEKLCAEQGIESACVTVQDYRTTVKLRLVAQTQQLVRIDHESTTPSISDEIEAFCKAHLSTITVVVISDYAKGLLSNPKKIIDLARAQGIPVCVDPKSADWSMYEGASLITPNTKEFIEIAGNFADDEALDEKGKALLNQYNIERLLLTRGGDGMSIIEPKQPPQHFPTHANEVFDVSGAGDTVIATVAVALASGIDIKTAAYYANIAAGLVVAQQGTSVVAFQDFFDALNQNGKVLDKIRSNSALVGQLKDAKAKGKRIVFTNGCFDILHAGHAACLQKASDYGDILVVAVNSDASVQRLKGAQRPINSLEDRMALLASLGCTDWIVSFEEDTPLQLIQLLMPDVLVKGGDYTVEEIVGAKDVLSAGGQVKIIELLPGRSTTSVVEKMKASQSVEI